MEKIYYTSVRLVDSKPKQVIVDKIGKVVNNNPSKEELKGLEKEKYNGRKKRYTDNELLNYPLQYYKKHGRPPTVEDFNNTFGYPSADICIKRFGSWSKYLKLAELDVDSMVRKGILLTTQQRGRLGEILIRDHFKIYPIDLAGENCNNPCDGICPNGKTYDVKSSKLYDEGYYLFNTRNKYKDEIELYYFLAFNKDWTKLDYGWRIPGEIAENDKFYIGSTYLSEFNIKNMEEYDITDELDNILNKYGYFEK